MPRTLTAAQKKDVATKDQIIEGYVQEEIEERPRVEIPSQHEFYKVPRRFGSIPVDELPLRCDKDEQYYKAYPRVSLPFQRVERITFGHPDLEPNRLFWGDNLHVMRMLPSNSIDLIYIDPPFFSGRNYNVIFGDQNEVRSFTDIWEGGMPGYLIWFNARLLEMKRLLKKTGTIYVHLDWHASHYVKIEMDKIFGYDNFRNEIVWCYAGGGIPKKDYPRKHDSILRYTKSDEYTFNVEYKPYAPTTLRIPRHSLTSGGGKLREEGTPVNDWWSDLLRLTSYQKDEWIGYPTQKPVSLVERIIRTSSKLNDVVADFFCGGGTTPAVAQRLGRRWIACDQSRIAVAVTMDRLLKQARTNGGGVQQSLAKTPDLSLEYWGVYETPALAKLPDGEFRHFVITAYDGRVAMGDELIHGYKNGSPLHVGPASQNERITKDDVIEFARAIVTRRGKHHGEMLAWAFAPSAQKAADELSAQQAVAVDFVKLSLVPIESDKFSEHVRKYKEYANLLRFVVPPQVRLTYKRLGPFTYSFDVSESVSLNSGGKIANVQWDFNYGTYFKSTQGYAFLRGKENSPVLTVSYKFPRPGLARIACKVQDDLGGEKTHVAEIEVR